ncbi:unnamed protein product, partial [Iphiclides podalirius]
MGGWWTRKGGMATGGARSPSEVAFVYRTSTWHGTPKLTEAGWQRGRIYARAYAEGGVEGGVPLGSIHSARHNESPHIPRPITLLDQGVRIPPTGYPRCEIAIMGSWWKSTSVLLPTVADGATVKI